ncbi:hypothetical protein [Staphylococcus haemolyticus]|uniref:hypothetical protein n=1 Tax=Staphylococcus haemolyticus TaxID=1283 RepID=UPI002885DCB4|nr:hypothetical protein [Staphylococcus haemolyticus]MDT0705561.1 hypothetical protein [Staphylococcus haemolyticus]
MNNKNLNEDDLKKYANISKINKHQLDSISSRIADLENETENLISINEDNSEMLDELIFLAESLESEFLTQVNKSEIDDALTISKEEKIEIEEHTSKYDEIDVFKFDKEWDKFFKNNIEYAERHNIDLHSDPFDELLSKEERDRIVAKVRDQYNLGPLKLDKYDYLFASLSGILSGLIDVFLIGEPLNAKKQRLRSMKGYDKEQLAALEDSKLNKMVHKNVDKSIMKFTDFIYEYDKKHGKLVKNKNKKYTNVAGAIGYLEERFKVPYDARHARDLGLSNENINMTPGNHHLKSLGHQPDIIGLFFSILDQFLDTTSVVEKGKIQIIRNPERNNKIELKGSNFLSKILCGVLNWLGHLMSDIGGASGTRGHENKLGAGIPMPFYELTQLLTFKVKDKDGIPVTFAKIAEQVFKNGYDFRFGITLAIPVALNELFIRAFWSIKEVFYHQRPLKEILKINTSREIDRLLLVGHGALCAVDGVDAFIRSGGGQNLVFMLSRMNLVAWTRFGIVAFKETVNIYSDISNLKKLDADLEKEWRNMI